MKKAEEKRLISLSEFDNEVSLYQLIPAGSGKGLSLLKRVVDYIHTSKPTRLPSILITGEQGCMTHARAFMRALGLVDVREIDSILLQPTSYVVRYFDIPTRDTGYILTAIGQLNPLIQINLIDILTKGQYSFYNYAKEEKEFANVEGILVMTATTVNQVPATIRKAIDYHVHIESYSYENMILATLQRLMYCKLEYRSEDVLHLFVMHSDAKLRQMVQLLQICLTLLNGRTMIEIEDVKRAADLLPQPIQSKS
jgi:hypothetical protein